MERGRLSVVWWFCILFCFVFSGCSMFGLDGENLILNESENIEPMVVVKYNDDVDDEIFENKEYINYGEDDMEGEYGLYSIVNGSVYFVGHLIEGIDVDSFEVYNLTEFWLSKYAMDKNNVYYENKVMDGVDIDSFEVIYDNYRSFGKVSKDKNYVYYGGEIRDGVDGGSFSCMNNSHYCMDINYVYDEYCNIIEGVDGGSFEKVSGNFYKDKDYIYFERINDLELINNSDSESFVNLGGEYSDYYVDNNNVYYEYEGLLEEADVDSFEVLEEDVFNNYGKDRDNYYYMGKLINESDVGKDFLD